MSGADPFGAFGEVVKSLGAALNLPEPVLGTVSDGEAPGTGSAGDVILDTGQVVHRPVYLVADVTLGQRVMAFYYQGGHAVAIVPIYQAPVGST